MQSTSRPTVFLSYSMNDSKDVEKIARYLGDSEVPVWFDKWAIVPGDRWQERIEQALNESQVILIFVGKEPIGNWQNTEIKAAIQQAMSSTQPKRIIPILLPGSSPHNIPLFLKGILFVDFTGGVDNARSLNRLISTIDTSQIPDELQREISLGNELLLSSDYTGAIDHYKKALKISVAIFDESNPIIVDLLDKIGNLSLNLGEVNKAKELFEKALQLAKAGGDSRSIINCLNSIGNACAVMGANDEASSYCEQAIVIINQISNNSTTL